MPYITYQGEDIVTTQGFYNKYRQFKKIGARLFISAKINPNVTLAELVKKHGASAKLASIKSAGWTPASEREAVQYETLRRQLAKKAASRAISSAAYRLNALPRRYRKAQRDLDAAVVSARKLDLLKIQVRVEKMVAEAGGWPSQTARQSFERACLAVESLKSMIEPRTAKSDS